MRGRKDIILHEASCGSVEVKGRDQKIEASLKNSSLPSVNALEVS
jgi:hypothetical protein